MKPWRLSEHPDKNVNALVKYFCEKIVHLKVELYMYGHTAHMAHNFIYLFIY